MVNWHPLGTIWHPLVGPGIYMYTCIFLEPNWPLFWGVDRHPFIKVKSSKVWAIWVLGYYYKHNWKFCCWLFLNHLECIWYSTLFEYYIHAHILNLFWFKQTMCDWHDEHANQFFCCGSFWFPQITPICWIFEGAPGNRLAHMLPPH